MRYAFVVAGSSLLLGCGTLAGSAKKDAAAIVSSARALPPLTSDDEFASLRADYEALDVGDPARRPTHAALEDWSLAQLRHDLGAQHAEIAYDDFEQAAQLWDPLELAHAGGGAAVEDAALLEAARKLEPIFRKRGTPVPVLTLLAVEQSLHPSADVDARWQAALEWLRGAEEVDGVHFTLTDVLSRVEVVWPSPRVIDALARQYTTAAAGSGLEALGRGDARLGSKLSDLFRSSRTPALAARLAALYLAASRPADALTAVRRLDDTPARDLELRKLLERWNAPTANSSDMMQLAKALLRLRAEPEGMRGETPLVHSRREVLAVVQRLCRDGAARLPTVPDAWQCVGEVAVNRSPPEVAVAVRAFERALALGPEQRKTWEALALLYQERLLLIASDDKLGDLVAELGRVEAFYRRAAQRFPQEPLRPSVAGAYLQVGRGFFNAGRVDEAVTYLERSLAVEPTVETLEQLGLLELKRGRSAPSAERYQKALAEIPSGPGEDDHQRQHYWRAKLYRGLGDALDLGGDKAGSQSAWKRSEVEWEVVMRGSSQRDGGEGARAVHVEAALERGKVQYLLGEREAALVSFERAVDADSGHGSTYADLLSFLVPRGEREEALDVYHRTLGRDGVSEYLKVYCTLWMLDLDRRAGMPEDPIARTFLDGVDGGKWYQELARWASGRETDRELEAHADTPAKRAEAAFYRAMRSVEHGDSAEAAALWKRVLETHMMAFFEYDMASYYLRHGVH